MSDANSSVNPSTPIRAKRTSGTSDKSPHKTTTYSPSKKKKPTDTNTTGPDVDFDIPVGVASLENHIVLNMH